MLQNVFRLVLCVSSYCTCTVLVEFYFSTCIPQAALKLQSIWRTKSPSPDSAEAYLLTQKKTKKKKNKPGKWIWEWEILTVALRTENRVNDRTTVLFFPVFFFFFAWAPWGNAEAVHSGVSPCFRESGCSYKRRWDRKLLDILCVHSGYHNIQLSFTLYYSDLINRAHRSDPPPQILQNRGLIYSPSFILLTYYESLTYFGYKALLLTLNQMSSLLWFNE